MNSSASGAVLDRWDAELRRLVGAPPTGRSTPLPSRRPSTTKSVVWRPSNDSLGDHWLEIMSSIDASMTTYDRTAADGGWQRCGSCLVRLRRRSIVRGVRPAAR